MAPEKQPRRKPATLPIRKSVKTSLVVDVDTHARWAAAAALHGQDRNAFLVDVLKEALRGIVVFDRRKSPGQVDPSSEVVSAEVA